MRDWVNLQDYLELNDDQANAMGETLYGDVATKASNAQGQLNTAKAKFGNEVSKGGVGGPGGGDYTEEEATANAQRKYSGPTSLEEFDPTLAGNVQDASQTVQSAVDPGQRVSVMQETFGSQAASGIGGGALDSFLVGASPTGTKLARLGKQYSGLLDSLGVAEDEAYDQSQAAMAASDANAKAWGAKASEAAARKAAEGQRDPAAGPNPTGFKSLREFMDSGSGAQLHEAAMYASPADWVTRGLGEAGYDGENVSQLFVKFFGINGNKEGGTGDWTMGNIRSAARLVQDQYGDKALEAWFNGLTPESWKMLQSKGNAGAQARLMRAWLQEHGYNKIRG